MTEVNTASNGQLREVSKGSTAFIWLALSFIASIAAVFYVNSTIKDTSFGWIALGFILSAPASFIGTQIGNLLRKIAMPDAFFSSGMVDTLKKRLFWAIGPQVIGLGIGQGVVWIWLFGK